MELRLGGRGNHDVEVDLGGGDVVEKAEARGVGKEKGRRLENRGFGGRVELDEHEVIWAQTYTSRVNK